MATVRTPFTDTTIQKRVISEMIGMIDWTEVPLLKRLGWSNEGRFDFVNWPPGNGKKIEWLEDTLSPTADALNGAIDASQLNITVDNGDYFQAGHILEIESEYAIVASVSGNTLTLDSRGAGGTTAATHADNSVVTVVGIAKKTGANYTIGHTTTMTSPYNYTQIIEKGLRVDRGQQVASDYGVADTMAYHLAKLIGGRDGIGPKGQSGELPKQLQQIAYKGKRQQPTNSVSGMAGGLDHFITTNLAGDTSTAMTRNTIETQLRNIYTAGGKPDLIITSAWGATKITGFYEGLVETERSEERGGSRITMLTTPVFADIEVLIDWQCPTTKTYIVDSNKVGWVEVRPFFVERKPSLGDYDVDSVLGEYSFVVCNEESHAIVTHSATK